MQSNIKVGILVFVLILICLLIYMHIVIELETCKNIDQENNEPVKDVKQVENIIEKYMKKKHKHMHRSEIIEDMRYSAVEGLLGGMFLSNSIEDALLSSVVYSLMGGFTSTYKLFKDINHVKN